MNQIEEELQERWDKIRAEQLDRLEVKVEEEIDENNNRRKSVKEN